MRKALKTSMPILISIALTAVLTILLMPKRTVTITVPPTIEQIDSIAVAAVEVYRHGVAVEFADAGDYQAHVDSLITANRVTVRVPVAAVHDTLPPDTIEVEVECACVPEVPGAEFRASFEHAVEYPAGDSTSVFISLVYSQYDWALHPSGTFRDFEIMLPEIKRTESVRAPSRLRRYLRDGLMISIGAGAVLLAK